MSNSFFQFKQFIIHQDACAMKVCTDACLFGAWCAANLKDMASKEKAALDVGAGTGLLSLMIRQKAEVMIEAVEIDEAATAQASRNIAKSPWSADIQIINTDVLHMGVSKSYDYIISNPPFYQKELQSADHNRNVALHSKNLTLPVLFDFIQVRLKKTGSFFVLLPYKRQAETQALLQKTGLFIHQQVLVRQTEKHQPFRVMLQAGFEEKELECTTLTIKAAQNQYTPEFTALLKDYYLYL